MGVFFVESIFHLYLFFQRGDQQRLVWDYTLLVFLNKGTWAGHAAKGKKVDCFVMTKAFMEKNVTQKKIIPDWDFNHFS